MLISVRRAKNCRNGTQIHFKYKVHFRFLLFWIFNFLFFLIISSKTYIDRHLIGAAADMQSEVLSRRAGAITDVLMESFV